MIRHDILGRGIYLYNEGELIKRHEELDDLVEFDINSFSEEEALKKVGYKLIDSIMDVYSVYGTTEHSTIDAEIKTSLKGIRYIIDVNIDEDACYYILVKDNLRDYLAILAMLQPLAIHKKMVQENASHHS
ncbi:hypothetical protein [Halomonas sp. WWR20]